jgi:tetratricopeptide (TPR) repeat protein
MSEHEVKSIVKSESAFIFKVENQITLTNKLIQYADEKLANEFFLKAYYYFKEQHYDIDQPPIEYYSKAIELKPNFAEAYFYRGFTKKYQKDWQGFGIDFKKTIDLDPNL